jgi:glyoxylase-like metal-dependent hydrolase (beta-lactamase superfamily II)/rhodanese-related sulfurtransferase
MSIRQLNPNACWTFLLRKEDSPEVALIDPVLEHVSAYLELLEKEKLKLTQVLDTHSHADHISGAAALKDHTGCNYLMHEKAPSRCVTSRLRDGQRLDLGGVPVTVMSTPGHTKDSISLVLPNQVLAGDTLFLDEGGAGRDDLPGGDPGEHWDSLQRLLGLPGRLILYPSHEYRGRKPASLDEQKGRNPHLKPKNRDEFIQYLTELKLGPADWMKDVLKANYACARDPKAAWIPVDVPACEVKGTLDLGVNDQEVLDISPDDLKRRMADGDTPLLLDVREASELESDFGHLDGVRNIPIAQLSSRLSELNEARDMEIVTVCRSGGRAHTASQILMQDGFKKVKVLNGGMQVWRQRFGE